MLNPSSDPLTALLQGASTLSRVDLLELQSAIDALVIATQPIDLDEERERRRPEVKLKASRSADGWIETSYKTIKGKRYGPYRYLRWYQGPVKKSKYLGRGTTDEAT
jgi:hypothetical protein